MLPDHDLLTTPLADLMAMARAVRDEAHGRRVTYSPKVFIPLTMLCRDRCGYCTFAKAPARLTSPYLLPDEVLSIARAGQAAGVTEALFTLGERPELRYPLAASWLAANGYSSTIDYLAAMCKLVLEETGLLPHANAGALYAEELAQLRPVSASQGMMLESLATGLAAHRSAPDKEPDRRLATLDAAGSLRIPFTTGILVGIGDDRTGQIATLRAIAQSHVQHGHVQEVIVQNFLPKPGTAMAKADPCPPEDLMWAIAVARLILPPGSPRAGPAQPVRRPGPAAWRPESTTGAASRPSRPTMSIRSGPGPRSTSCAGPPRTPATPWPPASPSTRPSPIARPNGSTRRSTSPCWTSPTPRAWPATPPGARVARSLPRYWSAPRSSCRHSNSIGHTPSDRRTGSRGARGRRPGSGSRRLTRS